MVWIRNEIVFLGIDDGGVLGCDNLYQIDIERFIYFFGPKPICPRELFRGNPIHSRPTMLSYISAFRHCTLIPWDLGGWGGEFG